MSDIWHWWKKSISEKYNARAPPKYTCQIVIFQMANQIDMNAQSELMASFEENLWSLVIWWTSDVCQEDDA